MPFHKPTLQSLTEQTKEFLKTYTDKRKEKDASQWGQFFRKGTQNKAHQDAAQFIQTISESITTYAPQYGKIDPNYAEPRTSKQKSILLHNVIPGLLFLELSRINSAYEEFNKQYFGIPNRFTNLKNSVLADLILTMFDINAFTEIPQEEIKLGLQSLDAYLATMTSTKKADETTYLQETPYIVKIRSEIKNYLNPIRPNPSDAEAKTAPTPTMI